MQILVLHNMLCLFALTLRLPRSPTLDQPVLKPVVLRRLWAGLLQQLHKHNKQRKTEQRAPPRQ